MKGDDTMDIELKVDGMHCKSCESLIAEELAVIKGITNAYADSKAGIVKFSATSQEAVMKAKNAIRNLGYKIDL